LIQLVINFTSLNTSLKVDTGREENAAEQMEPFIDVSVLARGSSSDHDKQLIQATLTFTAEHKSTNSKPAVQLQCRFINVTFTHMPTCQDNTQQ